MFATGVRYRPVLVAGPPEPCGGTAKGGDDPKTVQAVHELRGKGQSIREIEAKLSLSTNTVLKVLKAP